MKPSLFGASLFLAVAGASSAFADVVAHTGVSRRTPEEALRAAPPPPAECLNASGGNTCIAVYSPEDGPESLLWHLLWATADTEFTCLDRETADLDVPCDAPNAVKTVNDAPERVTIPVPTTTRR